MTRGGVGFGGGWLGGQQRGRPHRAAPTVCHNNNSNTLCDLSTSGVNNNKELGVSASWRYGDNNKNLCAFVPLCSRFRLRPPTTDNWPPVLTPSGVFAIIPGSARMGRVV